LLAAARCSTEVQILLEAFARSNYAINGKLICTLRVRSSAVNTVAWSSRYSGHHLIPYQRRMLGSGWTANSKTTPRSRDSGDVLREAAIENLELLV
jgi:hypothetical protein